MVLRKGSEEGVPYSLSRWTDIPGTLGKWSWFKSCLEFRQMVAFDPRTSAPGMWSLRPADTHSLVFWTKNPENLVRDRKLLDPYRVAVHLTATGWAEQERGTPSLKQAGELMVAASMAFETVHWRFSPVPLLPENVVLERFQRLLVYAAAAGLDQVFVSFLQTNDRIPETRGATERFDLLNRLADLTAPYKIKVALCRDDRTLDKHDDRQFSIGTCVDPVDFGDESRVHLEDCGCVLMVDPFTINESCRYDCGYCYARDISLSPRKRNTMLRRLPVTQ